MSRLPSGKDVMMAPNSVRIVGTMVSILFVRARLPPALTTEGSAFRFSAADAGENAQSSPAQKAGHAQSSPAKKAGQSQS